MKQTDTSIIDTLGGPAKVAEMLGYDKSCGGIQRVHNWKKRGIPPRVILERPDVFRALLELKVQEPAHA